VAVKSLPKILPWVAYPVEPLDLVFVQHDLPSPLLDRIRDSFHYGLSMSNDQAVAREPAFHSAMTGDPTWFCS